jgi:tight adherence protein B
VVTTLVVSFLASGIGAGILGLARTIRPQSSVTRGAHLANRPLRESLRIGDWAPQRQMRRFFVPTLFGLLCVALTGWPVAGILGVLGFATLPKSFRRVLPGDSSKRTEAVATWTELLRDSLAGSAGLAQAIVVTAASAPVPIRPQVGALATRLSNGVSLEAALRVFAREVDDPAAEFLVCALLLAATSRAQKLVEVLSSLIDSIREDVSMQLRVDASRASARSSVRTIMLFSLAFVFALAVMAHSYLSPFRTEVGQLVLGAVGLLYAVGLGLMLRLVRPAPEIRLLDAEPVR